jgi:hypothetical protein
VLKKGPFPDTSLTLSSREAAYFHYASEFFHSYARSSVGLLGPCFKTGGTECHFEPRSVSPQRLDTPTCP